jgi:hypothetical protein
VVDHAEVLPTARRAHATESFMVNLKPFFAGGDIARSET